VVALRAVVEHIKEMSKTAQSLSDSSASRTRRVGREDVARLARSLKTDSSDAGRSRPVIETAGVRHRLSRDLTVVIARAAALLADGKRVSVFAEDEMLTTQQAADRLNVSRQYLTRLIDRGDLPSIRVGTHRRVVAKDVAAFKNRRDAKRDRDLDELTALSEQLGGYALDVERR
jgi:excisionase family DNA binding protein